MKKIFFILFSIFIFIESIFANNLSGARVVIFSPDLENVSGNESIWLPGAVKDELESELRLYTDFSFVDNSNERKIKDLQRKSLNLEYDDDTSLEIGKLTSAEYAIFSIIRKARNDYTLSLSFTNLTTGKKLASVISISKKTPEELSINSQNAVSDVVYKLCNQLGIKLDANQIYVLQNGDHDLSINEQILISQREQENYMNLMNSYDSEIKILSRSTELSSVEKKAKFEAEKAIASEKYYAAKAKNERLLNEKQQRDIDAAEDFKRDIQQKQNRDALALMASQKAEQVRNAKLMNESVLNQIRIIESKKKTLLDIRSDINERIEEINADADAEYQAKKSEIENREYRRAELDRNNKPLEIVKKMREQEIEQELKKINAQTELDVKNLKRGIELQDKSLVKEINNDYQTLKKKRMVSSLNDDLEMVIGNYDGENCSWSVYLYLYSDGYLLSQEQFELSYTALTDELLPNYSDSISYNKYLDNVDLYSSLFSRGAPVICCEIDYTVEYIGDDKPSTYRISFSEIRVKNLIKDKIIMRPLATHSERIFTSTPIYDISGNQSLDAVKILTSKEIEEENIKNEIARIKKEEQQQKELEKIKEQAVYDQNNGGGGATSLRFGLGKSSNDSFALDFDLRIAINSYFFFYWQVGGFPKFDELSDITDYSMYPGSVMGFGINKRLSTSLPLNIYGIAAVGIAGFGCETGYVADWTDNPTYETLATYCDVRFSLGLDLPINEGFAIYGQINFDNLIDVGLNTNYQLGIALTMPGF